MLHHISLAEDTERDFPVKVMNYLTQGLHAKEIGEKLGISHRTVEVH